jgi:opacity protein-like surface antigen
MTHWCPRTFLPAFVLAFLVGPLLVPGVLAASHFAAAAGEFDADFDYVAGAPTHFRGANIGSIEERNTDIHFAISPQITQRFLLRLGAEWQLADFRVPKNAPLPDSLQQASAIVGVDCQLTDQWLLRAEFQPGVYSDFSDVSWRDVNAPLLLTAACVVDADFQWFAGLRVNLYSQYPVWPLLGMRWKFADEWTLNLILPNPRLEYDVNERLKLYLGGRAQGGTYRVADDFGTDHGIPKLNHEIVDQYELRIGPGVSWKIRRNVTIELDAGYMVYREFNYFEHHIVLRSDPAPYGQIACHARF